MLPFVGMEAPDFTLPDKNGQDVTLSSFRGLRNVLLVFFPSGYSGISDGELKQVRDDLDSFQNQNTQFLGVCVSQVFTLRALATESRYTFPLLSDFWPHGEVAKKYGVFDGDRGWATNGTFVIDKAGYLRWSEHNVVAESRDPSVWRQVLSTLF